MRKLSPEKLKELRKQGAVRTEEGHRFVRPFKSETKTEAQDPLSGLIAAQQQATETLVESQRTLLKTIELLAIPKDAAAMKNILTTQAQVVKILDELSKPKPLKNWNCTVSRDRDGKITTVAIAEK